MLQHHIPLWLRFLPYLRGPASHRLVAPLVQIKRSQNFSTELPLFNPPDQTRDQNLLRPANQPASSCCSFPATHERSFIIGMQRPSLCWDRNHTLRPPEGSFGHVPLDAGEPRRRRALKRAIPLATIQRWCSMNAPIAPLPESRTAGRFQEIFFHPWH